MMSLSIWEMLLWHSGGNHVFLAVPALVFPSFFFILFLFHRTVSKLQVNIILWSVAVCTCAKMLLPSGHLIAQIFHQPHTRLSEIFPYAWDLSFHSWFWFSIFSFCFQISEQDVKFPQLRILHNSVVCIHHKL